MAKKLMKAQNGKIVKSKTKAAEFSKDSANLDRDYKIFTNKKGTIVNYNKAEDNINNTMDKYGRQEVSKMGPVGKTIAKNKPDMFRKTGGTIKKYQPGGAKLKQAVTDSTQAKSSYDREYNKRLNDPNSEPFRKERLEYYQRKFDKPGEIRSKIPVKKSSGATKKTVPGNASFPSMTKKSVGITRIGKGVTFEKDKLGNGPKKAIPMKKMGGMKSKKSC